MSQLRRSPKSRRPLDAMVHYDRYDRSKQRTVEDLLRFVQEDLVQSKSYNWGGAKPTTSDD